MQSDSVKLSPFDLLSAVLNENAIEKLNKSETEKTTMLVENRELLTLFTSAVAVLIGFVIVYLWRRSSPKEAVKDEEPRKFVVQKRVEEPEVDDGKKRVSIFYGTQTGTAEGFAKAFMEEAKVRYEKAFFKVIDMDDYGADDDEYEEKLKKESMAFFFLATIMSMKIGQKLCTEWKDG